VHLDEEFMIKLLKTCKIYTKLHSPLDGTLIYVFSGTVKIFEGDRLLQTVTSDNFFDGALGLKYEPGNFPCFLKFETDKLQSVINEQKMEQFTHLKTILPRFKVFSRVQLSDIEEMCSGPCM
jgi:hypothetical protein